MNAANFESFRQRFDEACFQVLAAKGADYSSEKDRLENFKTVAAQLGVSPMVVWSVFAHKHVDALFKFAGRGKVESEPVLSRFIDARNYMDLGVALAVDLGLTKELDGPALDPFWGTTCPKTV